MKFLPAAVAAFYLIPNLVGAGDNADWLKQETQRLIKGCRIKGCRIEGDSGAVLHTPDGSGHYKGMWIREYYFIAHWDRIIRNGLVRHLPESEVWQRFFPGRPTIRASGVYMNGAYWSLPLPWIVPVVWGKDPKRARQMVAAAIEDFRANGVAECVNEDHSRKVPNYVASATNLYGASKWLSSRR